MNPAGVIIAIAGNAVAAMGPLLLASMGGLYTELSGTLNIALEGLILTGAFSGLAAASATGSLAAGALAGCISSALLAFAFSSISLKLKANIFITGLAANIFASGVTVVLSQRLFGSRGVLAFDLPKPYRPFAENLASLPIIGSLFFSHDIFVYLSWLGVGFTVLVLRRTSFGIRVRAAGANERAVQAAGFGVDRIRIAAFAISGAACGLAGASLSLPLAAYVPNMSSGRGWTALVAVYLGARKPALIVLACFVFALAESYSNYAQGNSPVPAEFLLALPYAATLAALVAGAVLLRGSKRAR